MIYYNDNEEYCCRVLRARIADGSLPAGTVDNRSISDVGTDELKRYKQIHLFAGIGGFPLALEWVNFGRDRSIITGGFPCQDLSVAGKGAGLDGDRSGLWWETLAAVSVVRPDVVFLENVSALLTRGVGTVLGPLASLGYCVQWHCVPAAYVGAPHRRDRIWIVGVRGVADTEVGILTGINGREGSLIRSEGRSEDVADAGGQGSSECDRSGRPRKSEGGTPESWGETIRPEDGKGTTDLPARCRETLADARQQSARPEKSRSSRGRIHSDSPRFPTKEGDRSPDRSGTLADAQGKRPQGGRKPIGDNETQGGGGGSEPPRSSGGKSVENATNRKQPNPNGWSIICRLGVHPDGIPGGLGCGGWECGEPRIARGQKDRAKRLKALGNAIVPQCAAYVLKQVLTLGGGQ